MADSIKLETQNHSECQNDININKQQDIMSQKMHWYIVCSIQIN